MATKSELFPSKYLKAADLGGKAWTWKIKAAPIETLKDMRGGEAQKCVVYFVGVQKGLVLNLTNFNSIASAAGSDDTADWAGIEVELYPTTTTMGGEVKDCIRIRRPAEPALPMSRAPGPRRDEMPDDDSIPF